MDWNFVLASRISSLLDPSSTSRRPQSPDSSSGKTHIPLVGATLYLELELLVLTVYIARASPP